MARPRNADTTGDTRERILRESARLFSELGYQGASTRAITEAVGIKQPSLFHYFAGKEAIGHELIAARLARSNLLSGCFKVTGDDPALDLYRLFLEEMTIEVDGSIDTRWLFGLPPAVSEMFPEWEEAIGISRSTVQAILARGISAGIFNGDDLGTVREIFDAVANQAMFWPRESNAVSPHSMSEVLLRLVIADQSAIAEVVARAQATEPDAGGPDASE